MAVEEEREEAAQESTARQQAEKNQLEKAQKEEDPKPADHAQTDKEQAQTGTRQAEVLASLALQPSLLVPPPAELGMVYPRLVSVPLAFVLARCG